GARGGGRRGRGVRGRRRRDLRPGARAGAALLPDARARGRAGRYALSGHRLVPLARNRARAPRAGCGARLSLQLHYPRAHGDRGVRRALAAALLAAALPVPAQEWGGPYTERPLDFSVRFARQELELERAGARI